MNLLQGLDGIESCEEIGDLMTHMDDADSSSAGLSDEEGTQMHEIEIGVPNESAGRKVRDAVDALAFDLEALVEFEEDEAAWGRAWRPGAGPARRDTGRRTRIDRKGVG